MLLVTCENAAFPRIPWYFMEYLESLGKLCKKILYTLPRHWIQYQKIQ